MEVFKDLCHLSEKYGQDLKLHSDSGVLVGIPLRLLGIPNIQFNDTSTEIRISLTDMTVDLEPKDGIRDPNRLLHLLLDIDGPQKRTLRSIVEHITGSPIEQTSVDLLSLADETETLETNDQQTSAVYSSNSGGEEGYSKYKDEYTEEGKLGYGGFGNVYKCRNKLDGVEYAVKFVAFVDCRNELRELRAMSIAQHPNVVRCFDAWIEDNAPHSLSSCSEASSGAANLSPEKVSSCSETSSAATNPSPEKVSSCSEGSSSATNPSPKKGPAENHKKALCIAMECCSSTLGKALEKRVFVRDEVLKIVKDIVSGLCHIHRQGIIHLDLSRDNIFFDSKGVAKIGDFGLAVHIKEGEVDAESSCLGKAPYRAPEWKNWTHGEKIKVDFTTDLFALGLIIFELCYPMRTDMERSRAFDSIKRGQLPDDYKDSALDFAKELLDLDPSKRPSASKILKVLGY